MKILIYGPKEHVFAKMFLEKTQFIQENITIEISDLWSEVTGLSSSFQADRLLLINKTEKEALELVKLCPQTLVFMCRGGEKEFQPTLTFVKSDRNHQYLLFENWADFLEKIKNPIENQRPLLSATAENDIYHINYKNFPELALHQKQIINPDFFWFSLYFSKIYLGWFKSWLDEINEQKLEVKISLSEKGKIKRLNIPFKNIYKGEIIFREGEEIELLGDSEKLHKLTGLIASSDEENIEVIFPKATPKKIVHLAKSIKKSTNLLQLITDYYSRCCSGYCDLSRQDYIYSEEDHYDKPGDFLRGYIPNFNKLHLPITQVKLNGPSKAILHDESQLKALLDMLGPSFLSLVQGGPGTGKTLLTTVTIKQLLENKKVVIVTSHSNKGLDNILETLTEHVNPKKIFRLGNNPELITMEKIRKLHRYFRYAKQREAAKAEYEKPPTVMGPFSSPKEKIPFNGARFDQEKENLDIWKLLCAGEGFVIAMTINSFLFDKGFGLLLSQSHALSKVNFSDLKPEEREIIPQLVIDYMDGDNKKIRPYFIIDVALVDEATKARLFELVPIAKRVDSKLILIGDTDQLGNVSIALEASQEMMKEVRAQTKLSYEDAELTILNPVIYPRSWGVTDQALTPHKTTAFKTEYWFNHFSEGVFSSLITASSLANSRLEVNRRSLEEITNFLNQVFQKKMKIGRFNPYTAGKVSFLDVNDGLEERVKTSYKNQREKSFVVNEILKVFKRQLTEHGAINLSALGVIATYRGQVSAIKERLRKELLFQPMFKGLIDEKNIDQILKELVNTVDAFQGSEKETIILSLVRANSEGRIGFSADRRRLYVALSRARNNLTIIGNSRSFLQNQEPKVKKIFGGIINFTQKKKTYSLKMAK